MQDDKPIPGQTDPAIAAETGHGHDALRRRLVRGALASGPVILTLSSRPVLAGSGGGNCIAPSQTLSGAMSHKDSQLHTCSGVSPGVWWQKCSVSNNRFHLTTSPRTRPKDAFYGGNNFYDTGSSLYKKSGTTQSMTLYEVLSLHQGGAGADPDNIGFHIVGALLNIRAGKVAAKALDENKLKAIWQEYATKGYYEPYGGGAPWYGATIVAYLKDNFVSP